MNLGGWLNCDDMTVEELIIELRKMPQNYQIMIKLINSINIDESRNPALLIARVSCLYFLIFWGGIFYV